MAFTIERSSKFKKDFKRAQKRGQDISLLFDVIESLSNDIPLDEKHHDHELLGEYRGLRECHVEPDCLLIYQIDHKTNVLRLVRTGSHADLFR